jgi:choline monooxygenase
MEPSTTPAAPSQPDAAHPHAGPLAVALAPRLYTDPSLQEAEQRLIFERTWQLAGHVCELPRPGSYLTAQAGSQPVLVLRDEHHRLRAYRNVCRHRGSLLLSGSGQCKAAIRCRYHGWTYRFDGTLIGVPEGLAFGEQLDKGRLGLMPARVEELCGLVFVNLDPDATPLAELVGDLPQRLAPYRIETLESFSPGGGTQPANWKVVADNYLEGYHIPIAHPGLMRMLDYKHYEVEISEHHVWFDAPLRSKPSSNRLERLYANLVTPMPGLSEADRAIWRYVFIYPNTTIDLYPDQVNTWQMRPDGVERTRDRFGGYRARGAGARTRVVQWANQRLNTLVLAEDVDLVKNVQRGLMTRGYACGPLSRRELAVAWFADRIRADLRPALEGS